MGVTGKELSEAQLAELTRDQHRQLRPATQENVALAVATIESMVTARRYERTGTFALKVPDFDSHSASRRFLRRLNRVIDRPTMASANAFFEYLGNARLDYGAREAAIIAKRKQFVAAREAMRLAKRAYLLEKGDFYGGRVRVSPEEKLA